MDFSFLEKNIYTKKGFDMRIVRSDITEVSIRIYEHFVGPIVREFKLRKKKGYEDILNVSKIQLDLTLLLGPFLDEEAYYVGEDEYLTKIVGDYIINSGIGQDDMLDFILQVVDTYEVLCEDE